MFTAARGSVSPNERHTTSTDDGNTKVSSRASLFSSSSEVNDRNQGAEETLVVREAHRSGDLREFPCTVRCLLDSGANVAVVKMRSLLRNIDSSTTRISAVNGTFDAPSGTIKAYLCPTVHQAECMQKQSV